MTSSNVNYDVIMLLKYFDDVIYDLKDVKNQYNAIFLLIGFLLIVSYESTATKKISKILLWKHLYKVNCFTNHAGGFNG